MRDDYSMSKIGQEIVSASRVDREKKFHDSLAETGFGDRRLINRLSRTFYSKAHNSPLWGPV